MKKRMLLTHRPRDAAVRTVASMTVCACGLIVAMAGPQKAAAAASARGTVSVADLDLASPAGMQTAHERLRKTARHLCSGVVDPWSPSHHSDYVRCVDATLAAAMLKLSGPVLVANAKLHGKASAR